MKSAEDKTLLTEYLKIGSGNNDGRVNIILDFHFYNLAFYRENGLRLKKLQHFVG